MQTLEQLLERIEMLEKQIKAHEVMLIAMAKWIETSPGPKNFEELGNYLAMLKGYKP